LLKREQPRPEVKVIKMELSVKEVIKCDNEQVGLESAIFVRGRSSSLSELTGSKNMGGLS